MEKLKLEANKRALVIVAHPDDETIWLGGTIMKHSQARWTIFSLCRASDRDRAPKFGRVCRLYGAENIITDLEDEGRLSVKQTVPMIKKLIKKKIGSRQFDYLFTHGANGEYGHPRHKGVHQAVKDLIDKKTLQPKTVFYFNYKKSSHKKFAPLVARKNSDFLLRLTDQELAKKKRIVAKMYGYAPNGVDVSYCSGMEAFRS